MKLFEVHGNHLTQSGIRQEDELVEEEKLIHCGEKRLHKEKEDENEMKGNVHNQYFCKDLWLF